MEIAFTASAGLRFSRFIKLVGAGLLLIVSFGCTDKEVDALERENLETKHLGVWKSEQIVNQIDYLKTQNEFLRRFIQELLGLLAWSEIQRAKLREMLRLAEEENKRLTAAKNRAENMLTQDRQNLQTAQARYQIELKITAPEPIVSNFEIGDQLNLNLREVIRLQNPEKMTLRAAPKSNLTATEAGSLFIRRKIYDSQRNPNGTGIRNVYISQVAQGQRVVVDQTTTLMWHATDAQNSVQYENIEQYLGDLRNQKFAGYTDWRLPTLEEAMSLMESTKNAADLHIDSIFRIRGKKIWTADKESTDQIWVVDFENGSCYLSGAKNIDSSVLAVRSQ